MQPRRPLEIEILCPEKDWRKVKLEQERNGYSYQSPEADPDGPAGKDGEPRKNSRTGLRYMQFRLQR